MMIRILIHGALIGRKNLSLKQRIFEWLQNVTVRGLVETQMVQTYYLIV